MENKLLRKIPIFKHLPTGALRRIEKIAKIGFYKKGTRIFSRSEAGNQLFIVSSGRIKIYITAPSGKRKTLAYLGREEVFGELALLDGHVRSATAEAAEDSNILLIPKKEFKKILLRSPEFTLLLLRTLTERLRHTNDEMENLLFKNVIGRLARLLLDLTSHSKKSDGRVTVPVRITHQEMADWIGAAREPITRALSMLRRYNIIDTTFDRIRIVDMERLRRLV